MVFRQNNYNSISTTISERSDLKFHKSTLYSRQYHEAKTGLGENSLKTSKFSQVDLLYHIFIYFKSCVHTTSLQFKSTANKIKNPKVNKTSIQSTLILSNLNPFKTEDSLVKLEHVTIFYLLITCSFSDKKILYNNSLR